MNKEIIIDGVDVSECKGYYFSPTEYHSCSSISQINELDYEQDTLCEQNPNCYFKQLARKTQECESLKEEIEVLKDNFDTATRDCNELIEELKQECEELKDARFNLNCEIYSLNRYRKALEEIEEYINNQGIDNKWNMRIQKFRSGILDIINKVKGEEF